MKTSFMVSLPFSKYSDLADLLKLMEVGAVKGFQFPKEHRAFVERYRKEVNPDLEFFYRTSYWRNDWGDQDHFIDFANRGGTAETWIDIVKGDLAVLNQFPNTFLESFLGVPRDNDPTFPNIRRYYAFEARRVKLLWEWFGLRSVVDNPFLGNSFLCKIALEEGLLDALLTYKGVIGTMGGAPFGVQVWDGALQGKPLSFTQIWDAIQNAPVYSESELRRWLMFRVRRDYEDLLQLPEQYHGIPFVLTEHDGLDSTGRPDDINYHAFTGGEDVEGFRDHVKWYERLGGIEDGMDAVIKQFVYCEDTFRTFPFLKHAFLFILNDPEWTSFDWWKDPAYRLANALKGRYTDTPPDEQPTEPVPPVMTQIGVPVEEIMQVKERLQVALDFINSWLEVG